ASSSSFFNFSTLYASSKYCLKSSFEYSPSLKVFLNVDIQISLNNVTSDSFTNSIVSVIYIHLFSYLVNYYTKIFNRLLYNSIDFMYHPHTIKTLTLKY